MFNHVMVGTNDIDRSKRFYDAMLAVLGAGEPIRNVAASSHVRLFYRHDGQSFAVSEPIDDKLASPGNGYTIAFKCSSAEQVREFHDIAVANGGASIEEPPGMRTTPWGRFTCHTSAIQMETSSAGSFGLRTAEARPYRR